jgi:acyl-CoA thioester hydrolase
MKRADYRHLLPIQTRWHDNDVYGHINNIVYYSYFDTVINRYLIAAGGLDVEKSGVIGVSVESHCQFFDSIAFPDEVEAGLRVGKLGNRSVRYEIGIFRGGKEEACAAGHFVHVFVDRITRTSVPIPDRIRAALTLLL